METNFDNDVKSREKMFSKMDYANLVNTLTENKMNTATRETRIYVQEEHEKTNEMMRG